MNLFQIAMLLVSTYFAYQVYKHIHTLKDTDTKSAKYGIDDVDGLVKNADNSFLDGNYKQASSFLQKAYAQNQHDLEILVKLGYVMAMQDQNEQALTYYKKALQLEPENSSLCKKIASVYRNLKQYGKAKELLERSIALDSTDKTTYYNYGNLLVDMNEKDKAVQMYKKALKIDPDFKEAKNEINRVKN